MTVAEWIQKYPGLAVTVPPDTPQEELVDQMLAEPALRDIYVAGEDGVVLGHVTHKKLATLFLAEHCPSHTRRQILGRITDWLAEDLMNANFAYARPEDELDEVLYRLVDHELEDLPVIDRQGRLLGTINLSFVIRELRRRESPTS